MARVIRILCLIMLVAALSFNVINASGNTDPDNKPKPLEIVSITPSGEDVPAARQITFKFNRPVLPVGRMERDASEMPIEIKPEVKGQWRWIDTSTLALMLDEENALAPATRYEITIKPGIKAEEGATLKKAISHTFITERPKVTNTRFKRWETPYVPVIQITFNQPVSKEAVEKQIFLTVKGQGNIRTAILAKPDPVSDEILLTERIEDEEFGTYSVKNISNYFNKRISSVVNGVLYRMVWLVYPKSDLPEVSEIEFKIGPGLESVSGPEKGQENRTLYSVPAFPAFSFLGLKCTDNKRKRLFIKTGNEQSLCNSEEEISLVFSSPVYHKEVIDKIIIKQVKHDKQINPYGQVYDNYNYSYFLGKESYDEFEVKIHVKLEPNQEYRVTSISKDIIDPFGRTLDKPIDISMSTDHLSPDYFFDDPVVLEKYSDTDMPFTVTNLDSLTFTYDKITHNGKEDSLKQEIKTPNVKDIKKVIPARIREMLNGQSGVIYGKVTTSPYIDPGYTKPEFLLAQVTPFHVHLKKSYSSILVWVTDMKTGKPVSGAKVEIYKDSFYKNETIDLTANPSILSEGFTDSDGIVIFPGMGKLKVASDELFVMVTKGDDIALIPGYFFNVYTPYDYSENIYLWGTTAQGVYKPGDTIQYKYYVRDQDNMAFIPAQKKGYALKVYDPEDKIVFEKKDLELSDFGSLHGEFKLPETCSSGFYKLMLSAPFIENDMPQVKVLVTDFSTAPFKVKTEINKQYVQKGDTFEVNTNAQLHDGGSYLDASARVTVLIKSFGNPRYFFPDSNALNNFNFFTSETSGRYSEQVLDEEKGLLDKDGNLKNSFKITSDILFGELVIESAVSDDRGKYVTAKAAAKYSSRDHFVGINFNKWGIEKGESCPVDIIVVNATGNMVSGIPVNINIERLEKIVPQAKKGENSYREICNEKWNPVLSYVLKSAQKPVEYSFIPKETGEYRITASIKDSKGREHRSSDTINIVERRPEPVNNREDNEIEIIADKKNYMVGETAKYTIKNPFPGTNALITIERNGVVKHWVEKFETETPVVEVKIEKDFFPGFYFSALVMSPRTEKPLVGNKDPGKPAFRMGYLNTTLDDRYKELVVEVKPEKESYKPGELIKVNLKASSKYKESEKPVELALVVINDEVFSLIKDSNKYFDPYEGFYSRFGLGVDNLNLLSALIGRLPLAESILGEAYDKAGNIPLGSALGHEVVTDRVIFDLRSNFKFVAYWNPSIVADKDGKASIEFEAPDNLTGWRIFAMAVTPTDQMGLGEGKFAVTKDTEIRPVMPNQVTEGDSFKAGFSIMNRTDKTRELTVNITAEGAIETDPGKNNKEITQTITAEPNKRSTVWLPLKTKSSGKIKFTAKGGDSTEQDGLVHELEVRKMVNLETSATYGTSIDKKVTEFIKFPSDIRTDVGNVKVSLSPTVIGNVEGAFQYMRDYPYICWEQNLTKAVMASHYQNLKKYMPADFTWEGSDNLTQSMLDKAASFQAPNGGMTYYTPNDQYADPYLSAYTAIAFSWLSERGYKIPSDVHEKLNGYLLSMLKKEQISDFYSKGMASTVRAVTLTALAKQGKIGIDDLKQYYPRVKDMDLFGKAHFLIATINIKGTEDMQKEVFNMILSHSDQTGGKYVFSETLDSGYSRILTSSLRTNAAILSSLIAYGKTEQGKALVGDIPFKIVRYITQTRKQNGRWENTQENIFCMNALIEFSQAYENQKPDMTIIAKLGQETMGKTEFMNVRDKPVELSRPIKENDIGRKTAITIEREGEGRLYYSAGMTYAPIKPNREPVNAGIDIKREYAVERNGEWVLLKSPMEIKRGELVRVDLFVSIPVARNFLVVSDPVPGGLEPVNSDLATSSIVDADKGNYKPAGGSWWFQYGDWFSYGISRWSFYHRELRHHAAIFYSEYLPAGNYHLSYTAQAIASGEFTVIPTHAEEMYDPDVFGKSSAGILNVKMEE
ncbi:MAG: large extracellular alpha-helical protein [Deltaproteobacteria bacterium]|nr:large extracellular alpha-helical protein [Deltaproteobacteria bacterium]